MIKNAEQSDALQIAILHKQTLTTSFLAKLRVEFLESLYTYLIKYELVIGYYKENSIIGFVSFSFDSAKMMKKFIFHCPKCILNLFFILIFSPTSLKPFLETYLSTTKSKIDKYAKNMCLLPNAELLSISVSPIYQQSGIGSMLIDSLENQLRNEGILLYKVISDATFEGANKLYRRKGFLLASQITIHDNELSNLYIKKL